MSFTRTQVSGCLGHTPTGGSWGRLIPCLINSGGCWCSLVCGHIPEGFQHPHIHWCIRESSLCSPLRQLPEMAFRVSRIGQGDLPITKPFVYITDYFSKSSPLQVLGPGHPRGAILRPAIEELPARVSGWQPGEDASLSLSYMTSGPRQEDSIHPPSLFPSYLPLTNPLLIFSLQPPCREQPHTL